MADNELQDFHDLDFYEQYRGAMITVYDNPSDFPGQFVGRLWTWNKGRYTASLLHVRRDTLEELRRTIPPFMTVLGRNSGDDPCIVEVWI